VPVGSAEVDCAPRVAKPVRKFLAPCYRTIETNNVTSANVTKGSEIAYFDKDRPFWTATERHPRFKEHVRTCLTRGSRLILRLRLVTQIGTQECEIIWREEYHDRTGRLECAFENVANVRRCATR